MERQDPTSTKKSTANVRKSRRKFPRFIMLRSSPRIKAKKLFSKRKPRKAIPKTKIEQATNQPKRRCLRVKRNDDAKGQTFMNGIYNKIQEICRDTKDAFQIAKRALTLTSPEVCFLADDPYKEDKNMGPNVISVKDPNSSQPQKHKAAGMPRSKKSAKKGKTIGSGFRKAPPNTKTALSSTKVKDQDDGGPRVKQDKLTTRDELYEIINYNLQRLLKQKNQDETETKWLTDHYYFVLDTNVLLQQISFIEDLMKLELCDTSGTVFYIPHTVMKELESLKKCDTANTKRLAKRAMKYLERKLDCKDKHFQVQSRENDHDLMISEINYSEDDQKVNCCLQVKSEVENVVLLTEDINLKRKAISKGIAVSCKARLTAPRPDI